MCNWRLGYQLAGMRTGRQWALASGSWLAPWHVPAYAIWGGRLVRVLSTRLACGFALGDTEAGPAVSRWPSRRFTLLRHSAQLRSALCASPSRTCAIGIGMVCISLLRVAVAIGFGGAAGVRIGMEALSLRRMTSGGGWVMRRSEAPLAFLPSGGPRHPRLGGSCVGSRRPGT